MRLKISVVLGMGMGIYWEWTIDFPTVCHKKTNEDEIETKQYFRRTMSSFSLPVSQYYLMRSKNQIGLWKTSCTIQLSHTCLLGLIKYNNIIYTTYIFLAQKICSKSTEFRWNYKTETPVQNNNKHTKITPVILVSLSFILNKYFQMESLITYFNDTPQTLNMCCRLWRHYLRPAQTSMTKLFEKIANDF